MVAQVQLNWIKLKIFLLTQAKISNPIRSLTNPINAAHRRANHVGRLLMAGGASVGASSAKTIGRMIVLACADLE